MTTWEQAEQLFQALDLIAEKDGISSYLVHIPPRNDSIDYFTEAYITTKDGVIRTIGLSTELMMWGGFGPLSLINDYGVPEKVYYSPEGDFVYFVLFYPEENIKASYQLSEWGAGDQTELCLVGFSNLVAWSPELLQEEVDAWMDQYKVLDQGAEIDDLRFQRYYERLLGGDMYLCSSLERP